MRPQKVQDNEMLEALLAVFRSKGYEGASLKDLAEASGLKKASLYHRFPGGKKEMTEAVLSFASEWLQQHIFQLLSNKQISPEIRLSQVLDNIRILYSNGKETCILRAMSMPSGLELFGSHIQSSMKQWLEAFTRLGIDFGLDQKIAKEKALNSLINIQGSLIVAKGMDSVKVFENTLLSIQKMY